MPGRIGALISYGDTNKRYYHVIGIVKDYLFNDLAGTVISPLMLSCDPEVNRNYGFLTIRLKPGKDLTARLAKMEAVMRADNPGYPVDFQFVDEQFNDRFQWQAHIGTLAGDARLAGRFSLSYSHSLVGLRPGRDRGRRNHAADS